MKIHTSDKLIAWLTLASGLSISAVAVWYSVAGLVAIFAAAAVPIIIMGVALEVSKLVATVWLKMNWRIAPKLIRTYLIIAITILMLITSMGIFGFLSKAHLDQAVPTGDVVDQVSLLDEKIKTQRENIDASRKALKQMDEAVDQVMARSTDEKGADKAANLRRSQQRERNQLQNDIAKAQSAIAKLNEERAPIAKDLRKIEAEVGPIKYIAALLYGDNPDQNLLEKAVRWVIIIIVIVFDPLAVILLLASQYSFQWFRKAEDEEPKYEPDDGPLTEDQLDQIKEETGVENSFYHKASALWPFPRSWHNDPDQNVFEAIKQNERVQEAPYHPGYEDVTVKDDAGMDEIKIETLEPQEKLEELEDKSALDEWNQMIAGAERAVEEEKELEDHEIIEAAAETEKQAMAAWKHDNPDSSLKFQRRLLEKGAIDKLPWEDYLKAQPDFSDDEAAEEAAKWALEQVENKKKDSDLDGERRRTSDKESQGRLEGYVQNAEQNESTIWQRVKNFKKGL
jgi:hypothetical protein